MRWLIIVPGLLAAYLLLWPVPIDPQPWTPMAPPPAEGVLAANERLRDARVVAADVVVGGEAVAFAADGHAVTGTLDGDIVRIAIDTGEAEVIVNTGGRPLGMEYAPDGRLIIADALRGLLAWDGVRLDTLLTEVDGITLRFADDLAITRDGIVYLSDASIKHGYAHVMRDVYDHAANGRLIRYELATGKAHTVLDSLYFANGVALSADEQFVLINETTRYRVRQLWIAGPRQGQEKIWVENLPGFPDNITRAADGSFWVALYGPRSGTLDTLLARPWMRKVVWRLPEMVHPVPPPVAHVLNIAADGTIRQTLMATGAQAFAPITSVREHNGRLWLGSLSAAGIAIYDQP